MGEAFLTFFCLDNGTGESSVFLSVSKICKLLFFAFYSAFRLRTSTVYAKMACMFLSSLATPWAWSSVAFKVS